MKDEEKDGLSETEVEMDIENKSRRSSILKPQKARNPLSTLDFSESHPDTTLAKATRRVSFATSNFIKPFAADAERNTIWDTTYEEEVNHTDSTKSSYDQTHASKTSECLNLTLIHSVTDLSQNEMAIVASVTAEYPDTVGNITNSGESLVSIARKLRSKSIEQQAKNEMMDFTLTNKTIEEVDMGNVSLFNKTSNISCPTTKFAGTTDIPPFVDKENVNPLINDVSLVLPRRNCSISSSTTKCFTEEMDFTKPLEIMEDTVYFGTSENNLDFTGLEATRTNETRCSITKKRESVMELTCVVSEEIADKENMVRIETQECKSRRKTIHFKEIEGNMDLTNASLAEAKEIITESRDGKTASDLKRKTILFQQSEDDMEFTSTFPTKIHGNSQINTPHNLESLKKVEITCFDDCREETKETNNHVSGILKNHEPPLQQRLGSPNSRRTICFNESEGEMEFTNVFSIKKDTVDLTDLKRKMSKSKSKLDCTSNLVGDIYSCVDTTSNDLAEYMELTKVCPTKTIIENDIVETEKNKTLFDDDMELTTDFTGKGQCDRSLKQNIYAVNTNVPINAINDKSRENLTAVDAKEISYCIARVNLEQPYTTISNSSLHLIPAVANNSHHLDTFSYSDIKGVVLDVENVQQKSAFADKCEEENPVSSVQKQSADIKRYLDITNHDDIKKRKIQQLVSHCQTPKICIEGRLKADIVDKENLNSAMESQFLNSEPVKIKSSAPNLSANLDMDCTMNLDRFTTPATSFHINLSPETLKILDNTKNTDNYILDPDNTVSKLEENSVKKVEVSQNEKPFTNDNSESVDVCREEKDEMSLKDDKSYFLEDTTPLLLAPDEFDCSNPEINSPNQNNEADQDRFLKSNRDSSGSHKGDYTLRSELVLTNIEQNLLLYVPPSPSSTVNRSKLSRQFKENSSMIKELCKRKTTRVVNLEEIHRQYLEESSRTETDVTESAEGDQKASAMLGLFAAKSLHERISEMSKSCKTYWELVKAEDDYYFFYTLFKTLPFKVHVHPDLGVVYSVHTYSNLSDIAPPICRYESEIFLQKLKQEHLLSVLGTKFDIITLLDYVYMSMVEIIDFHREYLSLVKKYGRSHQLTMNPDLSITFKILNVMSIIAWVITIKLPATSLLTITKEDVTAVEVVGQKVNVEHIRDIVENTPKGPHFLRNFIENVDDYATRISRRIRR